MRPPVGAGGPQPIDFAGLFSWFDASHAASRTEVAPDVGRVAQLDSRGGSAIGESARQVLATQQPRSDAARVGSLVALRCDGHEARNDRLECQTAMAFGPASATTGFVVVYLLVANTNSNDYAILARGGAGSGDQIMVQRDNTVRALGTVQLATGLPVPGRVVLSWRQDGATHRFYVNGTETFAGSLAHTDRTEAWVLGNRAAGTDNAPDMVFCEAVFYAALLSTTDHTALVNALLAKWGGELTWLPNPVTLPGGDTTGPAPAETLPTDVPGLFSWFDASHLTSITKDGANVVSRIDSRGGSATGEFATQATAGRRPLWASAAVNGRDALLFDGVDDKLTCQANFTAGGATASSSGFVVFRLPSEQYAKQILTRSTGAWPAAAPFNLQGSKITSEDNVNDYVIGMTWPGTWVFSWRQSGGTITCYRNGTQTYTGASGMTELTVPWVFGNLGPPWDGTEQAFAGHVCEAAFWPSLISLVDHDALVATLVTKWMG